MPKLIMAAVVLSVVGGLGCGNRGVLPAGEKPNRVQSLALTFGGFLKDGPEAERVSGVCGTDDTRNLLNCDLHNGLPEWAITEVTLAVTFSPYGKDDVRYYEVPILIKPRTTEHISVRLGLSLPPDSRMVPQGKPLQRWGWLVEGAKGYPIK